MRNMIRLSFRTISLSSGVIALFMGPAFADPACDAELAAIQAALDAPAAGVSAGDLEQAGILFTDLSEACSAGTPLEEVSEQISQQIRALLAMGGA